MDGAEFDRLTRMIGSATTRRSLLKGLIGSAVGMLGVRGSYVHAAACSTTIGGLSSRPIEDANRPSLIQPFSGAEVSITCCYGCGAHVETGDLAQYHLYYGVDFAASNGGGFPVLAAASGTVHHVEEKGYDANHNFIGMSHSIYIDHGGRWQTKYAHLILDQQWPNGKDVGAGQQIGIAGNSGADHVHLHFELRGGPGQGTSPRNWSYPVPELLGGTDPYQACSSSQQRCDNGTCITKCGSGQRFDSAACQCTCPSGKEFCPSQNRCVSACPSGQTLNPQNCNCGCPGTCPGNKEHDPKTCTCVCPKRTATCPGTDICVDTKSDPENCGSCGNSCNGGTCVNGKCRCTGTTGLVQCDKNRNSCTNTLTDSENCGACGHPCSQLDGEICCSGYCVDSLTDTENCGFCGTICANGEHCDAGKGCCPEGQSLCGVGCVDDASFQSDSNNCGQCGRQCGPGTHCENNDCVAVCENGEISCAGQCVDPQTNTNNCGACGQACAESGQCTNGACAAVATTGSIRVTVVDAGTGSLVPNAFLGLDDNGKSGAWGLFDGASPVADTPGDGASDGVLVFQDLLPGDYRLVFYGIVDPSSPLEPFTNIRLSPLFVDTEQFHWVSVSAGAIAEYTLSLTGPSATIVADWQDTCGNAITQDQADLYQLSLIVSATSGWWSGGQYQHGYFNGAFCTQPGVVPAVFGAGTFVFSPAMNSYIWPDSAGDSISIAVELGQAVHITPIFNVPCGSTMSTSSVVECADGQTVCPGSDQCVDMTQDPANCGDCGIVCAEGMACVSGACTQLPEAATPIS